MDKKNTAEKIFQKMNEKKLSPSEQLVYLTEAMQEHLLTAADLAKEQRHEELGLIINTVAELNTKAEELRKQVQKEPITEADVQVLRDVRPHRKSVQNMLDIEVAQTTKFEKLLGEEMGKKSAYEMRNSDNTWYEDESKIIKIVELAPCSIPEKLIKIREDKSIERGKYINNDTGVEIIFGRASIREIVAKAVPDAIRKAPIEARMSALYQMKEIIENAICFDSLISEYDPVTSKNKSPNTLFIHKMYGVTKYDNELYLYTLAIEEAYNQIANGKMDSTYHKLYSLRDIKITPMELPSLKARSISAKAETDTPLGATISIPQLYEIVKTYDKSFFENSIAVGRIERLEEIKIHEAYDKAVAEYNEAQANKQKELSSQDGNVTNTYSGKEIKTMENLKAFAQDNRSLQQWLDDYEAQKKEVEEKALEEISTEEDYEQLSESDQQLLSDFSSNKELLIETRMALDFVKTSTVVRPDEERELHFLTLMNSKEEYVHAIIMLTGGFDERMGKLLESTRDDSSTNRYMGFSNAPLMDKEVSGLIKDEINSDFLHTATVTDLVGVIVDTREQRENLRISNKNIINDTMSAVTYDKEKLHKFDFENDSQKEAPEIVESNDGYAMNTSRVTAENEKEISEKVNGNEVVHNEAPRATTTDPSKAGGNVKLEEANNKGTEDRKPSNSKDKENIER